MTNNIIANSSSGGDCVNFGIISVNNSNLIEDNSCSPMFSGDPLLAPLADNGGATFTHTLLSGSPAIDAADSAACLATDQRGVARPQNNECDIGAFEASNLIFLPIIFNNYPALPDLIVQSVMVSGNDVIVQILNQGEGPTFDDFQVDIYINPNTPPTAVNQTWETNGGEGLAWGIEESALPLAAGETVTLIFGDAFYQPGFSNFSGVIPAGAQIYAQVDAANVGSSYGAVLETHEINNEPYNNILGPLTTSVTILLQQSVTNDEPSNNFLPIR